MKKIEKLEIVIRKSDGYGIFHDSRGDVNKLAEAMNMMIEKQNEIIDVVNKLIAEKQ